MWFVKKKKGGEAVAVFSMLAGLRKISKLTNKIPSDISSGSHALQWTVTAIAGRSHASLCPITMGLVLTSSAHTFPRFLDTIIYIISVDI